MLETIITSKTRVKLLLKFFLNHRTRSYLRDLEGEFGESTNAIRVELNRLEQVGLLNSYKEGNKKIFMANEAHPLFKDLHNILLKHTGIDHVIDKVIRGLGGLSSAYLTGAFARGHDHPEIHILLEGENIDTAYLKRIVRKAEGYISRRIRYVITAPEALADKLKEHPEALLLWKEED